MRKVFLPQTLEALWPLLAEHPEAVVYAGGTDLLVKWRSGLMDPPALICLERIEELKGVEDRGEEVFIGGTTTHSDLLADPLIRDHFPVLSQAVRVLGSPPVRHMGTIGGNLKTASPAGDTLPPLYVLDGEVELRAADTCRRMPVRKFILGPGQTLIAPGEILYGVWLRKHPEFNVHHFEKVGQRKALAIALASMAAALQLGQDGRVMKARLAWGSVGPTVITSREAETALEGNFLSPGVLEKAAAIARSAVSPIDDVRATADYRRQVAGNLLLRLSAVPVP